MEILRGNNVNVKKEDLIHQKSLNRNNNKISEYDKIAYAKRFIISFKSFLYKQADRFNAK